MAAKKQPKAEVLSFPVVDTPAIKSSVVIKGTVNNSDREWEMEFNVQELQIIEEWISSKTICNAAGKVLDNRKKLAMNVAMRQYCDHLFHAKGKISNPKVRIYKSGKIDHEAIFIVADKYSVDIDTPNKVCGMRIEEYPTTEDRIWSMKQHLHTTLSDRIISTTASITKLVENEVDVVETHRLRPFHELLEGVWKDGQLTPSTNEEQKVGKKLWDIVSGKSKSQLNDNDRAICLITEYQYVIKSGFIDRAWSYVRTTLELIELFNIIKPVAYLAYQKFGVNDSKENRFQRISQAFEKLIEV